MLGSIFSAIVQVLMEGKLTARTADNLSRIIGEIVLVVHIHIYLYLLNSDFQHMICYVLVT